MYIFCKALLPLLPGGVDGRADQHCRVGAFTWSELLKAARVDFSDIQVSFLVCAHAVHAPQRSREIADSAPRVQQMTIQVVLQHLVSIAIESRQGAIGADLDEVEARWACDD